MDTTQTTYRPTDGSSTSTPHDAAPGATFGGPTGRSRGAFRRSRDNRVLGGVCAGLARTLNVDVALVRVLAVVLAIITNGIGALAYLAAWLVVPEEGSETTALSAVLHR